MIDMIQKIKNGVVTSGYGRTRNWGNVIGKVTHRSERHEHLHSTYGILVQLLLREGGLISERTNNFLTLNYVLFATFLVLPKQVGWIESLRVILPIVGLIMSVLQFKIIARSIDAADFWRSSIGLIEEDSDFWYRAKEDKDKDLDIFLARMRYLNGNEPSRQRESPIVLSRLPIFINKFLYFLPEPLLIYGFWLPLLILILWLLALILVCG
jgi:hypothetical protein